MSGYILKATSSHGDKEFNIYVCLNEGIAKKLLSYMELVKGLSGLDERINGIVVDSQEASLLSFLVNDSGLSDYGYCLYDGDISAEDMEGAYIEAFVFSETIIFKCIQRDYDHGIEHHIVSYALTDTMLLEFL